MVDQAGLDEASERDWAAGDEQRLEERERRRSVSRRPGLGAGLPACLALPCLAGWLAEFLFLCFFPFFFIIPNDRLFYF